MPAFAVRAKDGAPVAMPISWEELGDGKLDARTWTVRNAVERMKSIEDPWKSLRAATAAAANCRSDFRRLAVRSCWSGIFFT